jgi:hypothetical protein|tara:strand:+ start:1500 stop:2144 length:645 start_codon:yes stop_codon:yes gene_type:complete
MAYTYTTLKTAIQDYVQSTETTFVSQLPRFILNAEERILKECQLDVFRKSSQGTASNGNAYLQKPNDFLSQNSLSVINSSSKEFLLYKQASMLQDYTPDPTTTGVPQYYADWDEVTFLLSPTPNDSFTVELHYFYRPDSITTVASGTTWLGDNAELALLYGSLVEAYTFMKGEADLLSLYNQRFQEAIKWLKNLGEGLQTRDQYRYDRLRRDVA